MFGSAAGADFMVNVKPAPAAHFLLVDLRFSPTPGEGVKDRRSGSLPRPWMVEGRFRCPEGSTGLLEAKT